MSQDIESIYKLKFPEAGENSLVAQMGDVTHSGTQPIIVAIQNQIRMKLKSIHIAMSCLMLVGALLISGCTAGRGTHATDAKVLPPPLPAPASQDQKMAWFRDAKYGLFIHWGLYCIPAGEWKGQFVPGIGEWIMNREQIPVAEYSQLAGQFNPVDFNAEQWVQMAEDAGMKYIVITSKHHDGFAMYHSSVSPYNVYDATPFHRDPIHELAEACARHHIKFGFYYSQAQGLA